MTKLTIYTKTFLPVKEGNEELLKLIHDTKKMDFIIKYKGSNNEISSEKFNNYDEDNLRLIMIFKRHFTMVGADIDINKDKQCDDFITEIIPIIKKILEPTKQKTEARYYSDKATFESPDFLKHINKNKEFYKFKKEDSTYPEELTEHTLKYYNVLQENYKRWTGEKEIKLINIHNFYKQNFHVEDTKRIDVVLAIALSRKLKGIPIWLILVGPSGDMKSVQLNSFHDKDTFILHNLTSKTLVNGYRDKIKFPDLAPELDNKLVIIPDMAQILKLPPNEKGELWGQLRDLYDGLAGKVSGMGSRARYENLHVTLMAGSTPAIDGQILVHQDLGTRELIYRTSGNVDKKKSMEKCFENEEFEDKIKNELREITKEFLEQTEIIRTNLKEEIYKELMEISIYITYMRATAEVDSYTNELRNIVYPEEPTRIAKQLKRLYICLKSLDKNYEDDRVFEILWHIAKSSAFPMRIKVFQSLLNSNEEKSTSKISEDFHIGKKTAQRELSILWNMDLVECRKEIINSMYPDRTYDYWKINKNHKFVIKLKEENRHLI